MTTTSSVFGDNETVNVDCRRARFSQERKNIWLEQRNWTIPRIAGVTSAMRWRQSGRIEESRHVWNTMEEAMSDEKRPSFSTATVFAIGIFLAGAQDSTGETDLDVTRVSRRSYQVERPVQFDRKDKYPFFVIDLETTGYVKNRDAIIEIVVLKVDHVNTRLAIEERSFLVRPSVNIPKRIRELTGISNEDVAEADTIVQVIPQVSEFIRDGRIVAHNAQFDQRFLEHSANLMNFTFSNNEWVCTLKMSRRAWPSRECHRLTSFAREWAPNLRPHRALSDCRVTLELYLRVFEILGGDISLRPLANPFLDRAPEALGDHYDADLSGQVYVFSGFRDEVLAARIVNSGGRIAGGISKKVTMLLVEEMNQETGKMKKAMEYGIEVQSRSSFVSGFYLN